MKELVVISGKGGTGKTSLTAAFATLAARSRKAIFADCDVDAADLHLILAPSIISRSEFISGREAFIDRASCINCGRCAQLCRFEAIHRNKDGYYEISACEGCGVCVDHCLVHAIQFPERRCGEWYVSDTRFGPLVHARLDAGAENSGKLVSLVKREARKRAEANNAELILVDACPGIGCSVIASITGADLVLAVVEPSLSSAHDLRRVIELTRHFRVTLLVLINKFDINERIAIDIKNDCERQDIQVAGFVAYETAFTSAQLRGQSIIEFDGGAVLSQKIEAIWNKITEELWKR